jgi:aspartyl protease family protein
MATERMGWQIGLLRGFPSGQGFMLAAVLCLWAGVADAVEVGLVGMLGSRALLVVGGGDPVPVGVGQSVGGVKLVSASNDRVIVEVEGKRRALSVGQQAMIEGDERAAPPVILTADSMGHFLTMGNINGRSIRFLVDTGASMVSLSAADAAHLGIDLKNGKAGTSQTANGQAATVQIKLDTVQVGGITLHNVDAVVHQTDMPFALLGMSFLNRMEMRREGDTMTLKKRF